MYLNTNFVLSTKLLMTSNVHFILAANHLIVISEPTIITSTATQLDVTVGESIVIPCQVSRDPSLDVRFTWFFNEQLINFGSHGGYFEKVGGVRSFSIAF